MTLEHSNETHDHVVIGAGIFGMYAALRLAKRGKRVLVVDKADEVFSRASHVNQARIHRGYHYPRSLATALKTAEYVARFARDYDFAVNRSMRKIYAIARNFSYTNPVEFEKFCARAGIPATRVDVSEFFRPEMIESAYLTEEFGFDAERMKAYFLRACGETKKVEIALRTTCTAVERDGAYFVLTLSSESDYRVRTPRVLNATYAGLNSVIALFGFPVIPTKYELAELALCTVPASLANVGLTVMDGPFFSLMPFGFSDKHSLTAVSFTPHKVRSEDAGLPDALPGSHFPEMRQLARKFLREDIDLTYSSSLFATKAIPQKSELDDARPTMIVKHSSSPEFVSVLSGKLNTIFDLDTILDT